MNTIKETLLATLFSLLTFFAPAAGILLVVLSFVFTDTILAYIRVKKQQSKGLKIEWTSRNFIRGFIPKMLGYTILVLLFFMLDKFLLNEFVKYVVSIELLSTKLVSLGLIYGELQSIDENSKVIWGKGIIKRLMDVFNFGNKIKNKLSEVNKDKKDESN